jgi:hypothetical protein
MPWARTNELEAIQSLPRVRYFLSFFGGGRNFIILYASTIMLLTTERIGMCSICSFKLLSVPEVQILLDQIFYFFNQESYYIVAVFVGVAFGIFL